MFLMAAMMVVGVTTINQTIENAGYEPAISKKLALGVYICQIDWTNQESLR